MQEIDYTFDAVNNITGMSNAAGVLNNGLGGDYRHSYNYDNSYRLISSNGLWDNNNNSLNYQLALTYTNDGRITTKTQAATTLIGGALSNFSYDNHYTYYDNQPHTVERVLDAQSNGIQDFYWDANGNLALQRSQNPSDYRRKLCWDEENRLMAVGDNNYTSYYQYDNSGERTYKLTGLNTLMNINGRWVNFATMDNPTLYTSAYLVAGVQGYTKHYYAGSERVSSAIGLGGLANINNPLSIDSSESWERKSGSLRNEMRRTIIECLEHQYRTTKSLEFLHDMTSPTAGTMDRYFYHPDHLGSSSVSTPLNNHWITDGSGNAIQHLHYLPFGEDWVDQRNASWSAPYTFSGKEKDVETGYSYFGARYYDSGLSIWLSVDPMSDKYPNLTPYAYCANNPVILVDPDGNSPISIAAKFAAKRGSRAVAKLLVKNLVTDRLKAYSSKKWAKQLLSDALDGVDIAMGQSWWEYAIEFVPIVGDAYGGYKLTTQGIKVAKFLERFENRVDAISTSLKGVAGGKLRKALGLSVNDGMQAHHIIPIQLLKEEAVVQDAVAAGFDFNGIENGIAVLGNHGPHKGYSEHIRNQIDKWKEINPNYTPEEAKSFIEKVAKSAIEKNNGIVKDALK